MSKKLFAAAIVVMLAMSVPAFAEDKGWFIYGAYDHGNYTIAEHELKATKTMYGLGVEKSFKHDFFKKLGFEYLKGSAESISQEETVKDGGRNKLSLSAEVSLGKGWTLIPAYQTNNGWASGQRQKILTVKFGKRF
jgi:hypothetical protein